MNFKAVKEHRDLSCFHYFPPLAIDVEKRTSCFFFFFPLLAAGWLLFPLASGLTLSVT